MRAVPGHRSVANSGGTLTSLTGRNSSKLFRVAVEVCSERLRLALRRIAVHSRRDAVLGMPTTNACVAFLCRTALVFVTLFATASSAFTPGNLAILRMGDGSAPLTNSGTALFL